MIERLEAVRHKTYFGTGAHKQCTAKNRQTGARCKNPAAFGMKTCKVHGARKPTAKFIDDRTGKPVEAKHKADSPFRYAKRYLCSLAFSDDLNDVVSNYHPKTVLGNTQYEHNVYETGKRLHELINKKRQK